VAAANERNKHLLDQFFMADDHPSHLGAQPVEGPPRVDDTLFDFLYGLHDATPDHLTVFSCQLAGKNQILADD